MKIRALVFEDDEFMRSVVSSLLKQRGYDVFEFPQAGTCPLCLKSECPCPLTDACADIIITDINMPRMTGLEFIENQRAHGCKVKNYAVMSFLWTSAHVEHAKKLGCHILEKPFKREDLDSWLDECEKRINPERKLSDWFRFESKQNTDTA